MDKCAISIIMPALNEEANIAGAIADTLRAFGQLGISAELVVVNDGSSDGTLQVVTRAMKESPVMLRLVSHSRPLGIGASFWDGVDTARGELVCMLPGDNENDPMEILRYLPLSMHVDVVIPFVVNRGSRSWLRNVISRLYTLIINATFGMSLIYTNGTCVYRTSALKELDYRCAGFFFQTDILVRLLRRGYLYAQVPYRLRRRQAGASKAVSCKSLRRVCSGYLRLVRDVYVQRRIKKGNFSQDSISRRYQEGA